MRLLARNEAIRTRIGLEAARTMREGFSETAVGCVAEDQLKAAYARLASHRGMRTGAVTSN
jgi:2-keto-3-deoxy-galactonokinase